MGGVGRSSGQRSRSPPMETSRRSVGCWWRARAAMWDYGNGRLSWPWRMRWASQRRPAGACTALAHDVVVDLSAAGFLDSSGLTALFQAYKRLQGLTLRTTGEREGALAVMRIA